MPIDRRTFVLGSGVAFTSFGAIAAVEQAIGPVPAAAETAMAAVAAEPSFELRILGWDCSDDRPALGTTPTGDSAGWITIDQQWRGAWR